MKVPLELTRARNAFRRAATEHRHVTESLTAEDKASPRVRALLDSERDLRQAGIAYASAIAWSVAAVAFLFGAGVGFASCWLLDRILLFGAAN